MLAELIKSTQNEAAAAPEIATQARLVREAQAQAAHDRPSWQTLDTVDFQLLDPIASHVGNDLGERGAQEHVNIVGALQGLA